MKEHETQQIKNKLKGKGLKSTPLRIELLYLLEKHHEPLSAEKITQKLQHLEFDRASLFRTLKTFTDAGLLKSVDLGEGHLRFEATCTQHGHHHHIMCVKCKRIEVVPFCIPPKVTAYLFEKGYSKITHRMDFSGLCAKCA